MQCPPVDPDLVLGADEFCVSLGPSLNSRPADSLRLGTDSLMHGALVGFQHDDSTPRKKRSAPPRSPGSVTRRVIRGGEGVEDADDAGAGMSPPTQRRVCRRVLNVSPGGRCAAAPLRR